MNGLLAVAGGILMVPANLTWSKRICLTPVTALSEGCGYAGLACWTVMAVWLIGGGQ